MLLRVNPGGFPVCVKIELCDLGIELVCWRPENVAIYVRRGASPQIALAEIRAILEDLDAPRYPGGPLLCFCGDAVPVPTALIEQATTHNRQVRYGA